MIDEQTTDIMATCGAGMVKVIFVCILGIIASKYPQDSPALNPNMMKGISKIANMLFMPALITLSLGKGLTLDAFIAIGGLSFCMCAFVIFVSGLLSYFLGLILIRKQTPLLQTVVVACAFSNSVPIPALLLSAVCKYDKINKDYEDIDECYIVGMSTIFVYQIVHSTLFWGGVSVYINEHLDYFQQSPMEEGCPTTDSSVNHMGSHSNDTAINHDMQAQRTDSPGMELATVCEFGTVGMDGTGCHDPHLKTSLSSAESTLETDMDSIFMLCGIWPIHRHKIKEYVHEIAFNPPMIGVYAGLIIGLNSPLQELIFSDDITPLSPVGSTINTIAQPVICLTTLILAGSLARISITSAHEKWYVYQLALKWMPGFLCTTREVAGTNSDADVDLSVKNNTAASGSQYTALEPVVSDLKLNPSESDPSHCTSVSDSVSDSDSELPSWEYIAIMMGARLILPPLIVLPVANVFNTNTSAHTRMLLLVIVLECSAPSTTLIMLVLNKAGLTHLASKLAYLYVYQYLASILTVSFWLTIGISLIY